MSPAGKIAASSNLYTAILSISLMVALAAIGFVAYKSYFQYGTIFTMP